MWESRLLIQDPALGRGSDVMGACPCSTVAFCKEALTVARAIASFADHWKNTGCAGLSCTCSCRIRTKACWFLIRECSGSPPCTSIWLSKDGMGRNRFPVLWSEHQSSLEQEVENFPSSFFLHHIIWNRYLWQLTMLLIFSSGKAEHCPGVRTPTSCLN